MIPIDTPLGPIDSYIRLFPEWTVYKVIGRATENPAEFFTLYLVDQEWALRELDPVTLAWSLGMKAYNGFYCYTEGVRAAMLAWDNRAFMEQVDFAPGLALATESHMPDDWITVRRDAAEHLIRKQEPQFFEQFFGQYASESLDNA